jgi:hypothetical protein
LKGRFALGVAAAMIAGAGLRLHGLTRHPLWLDEAEAVRIALLPMGAIPGALVHDTGPPLYYLVLHVWIRIWGDGEAAVRALSVLSGVLLVPASAAATRRAAGARAGILAAFLAAVAPFAAQFSQEARMYAPLALLAALGLERLLAYMDTGSRAALAAHAALAAAAAYTHNWGLLLLPASAAAVLAGGRERLRGWSAAALGVAAVYAPWIPVLRAQAAGASYRWVELVQDASPWELPLRSLLLFAWGVGTAGGEARSLLPGLWAPAAGAACAALAAVAVALPRDRRRAAAVAAWTILPPAAAALVAALGPPVYLAGRHEILVLPGFLALVAAGAAALLPGRFLAYAAALWVLLLGVSTYGYTASIQRRTPEKDLASRLAPRLEPGDAVVFTGLQRAATEYHLRRAGAPFRAESFPEEAARHPGWIEEPPALSREAAEAHCPRAGSRAWIVATRSRASAFLLDRLGSCAELSRPFADQGPPWDALVLATPPSRADRR